MAEILRKATVSFILPVCLSVRMEQLGSYWAYSYKVWCLNVFFSKTCRVKSSFIKIWQE